MILHQSSFYDLPAWGVNCVDHSELKSFAWPLKDAEINRFFLSEKFSVDCFVEGNIKSENCDSFLVFLSGAVSDRLGKKGPFFSGISLARELGMAFCSVADSTLSISEDLTLSWYAGNVAARKFQKNVAEVINHIAISVGKRPIIVGGSGGGFAALQIASMLSVRSSLLIWNPQTSIADYSPKFVHAYLSAAFPDIYQAEIALDSTLLNILKKTGINFDVRNLKLPDFVDVIYLQNENDWHVNAHLFPLMDNFHWENIHRNFYLRKDRKNYAVYIGKWGDGHAPIPKEMLKILVNKISLGFSSDDISGFLEKNYPALNEFIYDLSWNSFSLSSIDLDFFVEDDLLKVNAILPKNFKNANYAFYLLIDGLRTEISWYKKESFVEFKIPEGCKDVKVTVFIQNFKKQKWSKTFSIC